MMRRFVNLISHDWCSRADSIYSLHRIDVAGELFYPSTAEQSRGGGAEAANKEDGGAVSWPPAIQRLRQLPAPAMTFQAASMALRADAKVLFFALLNPRDSESRILFSSRLGHSVLYDADANCVTAMPALAGAQLGPHPITISLALPGGQQPDPDLYVMHDAASTSWDQTCCFGAFRFDETMHGIRKAWRWDPLPAPPLGPCTAISSHAVVDGGRAICVSAQSLPGYAPGPSTYCFDTVKREWRRAGDWVLPFEGGAEHVPPGMGIGGGGLWLGFAGGGRDLCAASGLSSAAMETAPAHLHVWRDAGGKVPDNWRTTCPKLLDLGGGKFCVAKTCFIMPDAEYDEYDGRGIEVAVLSGVELLAAGGSIDMVEHKSLGYICRSDSIRWVL